MRGWNDIMRKSRGLQPARRSGLNGTPPAPRAGAVSGSAATTEAFTLSARPRGLKPAARCRAFSLAEVMIAIGILGVGLLMVAATFPVGLDQSRIVAEQTIAPLVAEDAFQRLEMLINEPATFKRIPVDATSMDPADPTQWPFSVRQSLLAVAAEQLAGGNVIGPIRAHLSNGNPADDPANPTAPYPYRWTGLNELLVAPFIPPTVAGQMPQSTGIGARFYPSIAAQYTTTKWPWNWSLALKTDAAGRPSLVEPPYTWSALYRVYSNVVAGGASPTITNFVQLYVFVNRRGEDWPSDWPQPVDFTKAQAKVVGNEIWFTPGVAGNTTRIKLFSEGGFILVDDSVPPANAKFPPCRVRQIELAKNPSSTDFSSSSPDDFHRLVLDQTPPNGALGLWAVPADTSSGRSPCIGVYSRTFPLQ